MKLAKPPYPLVQITAFFTGERESLSVVTLTDTGLTKTGSFFDSACSDCRLTPSKQSIAKKTNTRYLIQVSICYHIKFSRLFFISSMYILINTKQFNGNSGEYTS